MKRYILYILLVLCGFAEAQISVTNQNPYHTAQNLVRDVLLGNGITANNFTFNGDPMQMGFFDGTASNIGLDSGIVLACGDIQEIVPNATSSNPSVNVSDADLLTIANSVPPLIGQGFSVSSTNDAAILEFDFVPTTDTVEFRYVFGSDEYLTWINSSFNDVFAFFISGPGITGPYSAPAGFPGGAQNIAFVPNTNPNLPITISSVQPALNSQYYINNPIGAAGRSVDLNGFTTPFVAWSEVQCGQTYHIKLAIADGTDQALISSVFLEAGSFSSKGLNLSATPTYNNTSGDTVLYEGCGAVELFLTRGGALNLADTVIFNISGTAISGTDYTPIPDTVYFAPGQDSVVISFTPFLDGINETMETIIISAVTDSTSCGGQTTLELALFDHIPLITNVIDDTLDCFHDSIAIMVEVLSGIPVYEYDWGVKNIIKPDSIDTLWVSPTMSQNYLVTTTDACGVGVVEDTIHVHVIQTDIDITASNTTIQCAGDSALIKGFITGGLAPYDITWSNNPTWHADSQYVDPDTSSYYTMYATDQCRADTDSVKIFVAVTEYTPLVVEAGDSIEINCPRDPVNFLPAAFGGSGDYVFTWDNWFSQDTFIHANPDTSGYLIVGLTDFCRNDTTYDSVFVTVPIYVPIQIVYDDTLNGCEGDEFELNTYVRGGIGDYSYYWDLFLERNDSVTTNVYESTVYELIAVDECRNYDTARIHVMINEPIAEFTILHHDLQDVVFQNRSSEDALLFNWDFGDGGDSDERDPIYSYSRNEIYTVTLEVTNQWDCIDSVTKFIEPPFSVWIPNAFTPNADGVNDKLEIYTLGVTDFEFQIFNRWGDLVFQTTNPENYWDGSFNGSISKEGVFIYKVKATGITTERLSKTGTITLFK
ncbi:MAG: choice-of-anchor L domain-containing protein [Flavobacteriales bacterium]|nr:choice-of-anchor L domain-containing protein [Flavobacteriales bacterium]